MKNNNRIIKKGPKKFQGEGNKQGQLHKKRERE